MEVTEDKRRDSCLVTVGGCVFFAQLEKPIPEGSGKHRTPEETRRK